MEIKIDIKVPNDNTNTPHGNITLKSDRKYTYITHGNETIAVDVDEMYRSIKTLYGVGGSIV